MGGGACFLSAAICVQCLLRPRTCLLSFACVCLFVCGLARSSTDQAPPQSKQALAHTLHQYLTLQYFTTDTSTSHEILYQQLLAPVRCLSVLYRANFGVDASDFVSHGGAKEKSSSPSASTSSPSASGAATSNPSEGGVKATASAAGGGGSGSGRSERRRPILKNEDFYNDVLNNELSLEQDLKRWREGQPSLCQYPCVLTAASKARILQVGLNSQTHRNSTHCVSMLALYSRTYRTGTVAGSSCVQLWCCWSQADAQSVALRAARSMDHFRSPYLILNVSTDTRACMKYCAHKKRKEAVLCLSRSRAAFLTHCLTDHVLVFSYNLRTWMRQVSRANIIEDCLQQLAPKSETDLKMQLKVKFKGEEGIDEGGVAKEFFQVRDAAFVQLYPALSFVCHW